MPIIIVIENVKETSKNGIWKAEKITLFARSQPMDRRKIKYDIFCPSFPWLSLQIDLGKEILFSWKGRLSYVSMSRLLIEWSCVGSLK